MWEMKFHCCAVSGVVRAKRSARSFLGILEYITNEYDDGCGFLLEKWFEDILDLSLIHISEPTRPY